MNTSAILFTGLVLLVGLERVAELIVSQRNARWSVARGGVESGSGHYPVMVALHSALLLGAVFEVWFRQPQFSSALGWPMLVLVVLSQLLRWWCIGTLGTRWNTRIIVVPGLDPISRGPYRRLRHPNYVAVVVEGLALPLVHSAWITAILFTVLNAAVLTVRIRSENRALGRGPAATADRP